MHLFPAGLHLEFFQQHPRPLFQVQGVQMQTPDPQPAVQDIPTHLSDQLDSHCSHGLVIVLNGVEDVPKVLWNDDILPLDPGHELLPTLDRHDPGDDRHRDPSRSDPLDPVDKDVDVVKHLSKDEVGSSVDFGLEELDLLAFIVLPVGGLGVSLRETGDGDIKVVPVLGSNVFDEVDGFGESAGRGLPFGLTVRRVSSEGEDVLTAVFLGDLTIESEESGFVSSSFERM
jgi:hypothetical protein